MFMTFSIKTLMDGQYQTTQTQKSLSELEEAGQKVHPLYLEFVITS